MDFKIHEKILEGIARDNIGTAFFAATRFNYEKCLKGGGLAKERSSMGYEGVMIGLSLLIAGLISLELGVSTSILEIVAGLVARNLLGMTEPPWLDFLANLGLLGLMFFAGFEIDRELLKKEAKGSLTLGISAYFVPLCALFITSTSLLGFNYLSSLLVAISLSTTSLALVYPLLRELGLMDKREGQLLLAGAMVVDVLSMISLNVVFESFSPSSLALLAIIVISLIYLPKVGGWLFIRYRGNLIDLELRFLLLTLASLSLLSERAKIHYVILAFATGLAFSDLLEGHKALEDKLKGLVFGFAGPLFFFKAGYSLNLTSLRLSDLLLILLFSAMAFSTKYLGTLFALRSLAGLFPRDKAGLLYNLRLSFGVVAALFGLEKGLISPNVYVALLTSILATSITASALLKALPSEA